MNYMFQVRGFVEGGFDYSTQTLSPLTEAYPSLSESVGLGPDIYTGQPAAHLTRWYAPVNDLDVKAGNYSKNHCDGTPLGPNDVPEARVNGKVASGGTFAAPLDWNNDFVTPSAVNSPGIDLNYDGGAPSAAPFSGFNDWDALNLQQLGGRENAFGFSGGGVKFEGGLLGGGVKFEGGLLGGGVDSDGGGVKFEGGILGGGVKFEGGLLGGGVGFGIDLDEDTATATLDPPGAFACTVAISGSSAPVCTPLSPGIYQETGSSVPLTWTAPDGQIRGYTIWRATGSFTTSADVVANLGSFSAITTVSGAPPVRHFVDSTAAAGNTYTYFVRAQNKQGVNSPASDPLVVTVVKATPTISVWPTASAITYGQTLASSTLTGGTASVAGTFAFTTPSTKPDPGTSAQSVTFTPTDTASYNSVTGTVNVTVNKVTPTVSVWPTASAITYGQTLASSTLTGGTASVAGSFAFTTPATQPATGTSAQGVTFTPTDSAHYNSVTGTVNVTVGKATPIVSVWPTASTITYGQTLASSTLSGGTASVAGTFAFTTPTTKPAAGTSAQSVTFTPTDTVNYKTVTGTVNVTVIQATVTVSIWPKASNIILGQSLSSSKLTGGKASVSGTFAWTYPNLKPPLNTTDQSVTFTPDNSSYSPVVGTVKITVTGNTK